LNCDRNVASTIVRLADDFYLPLSNFLYHPPQMATLLFDIESVGFPLEHFDEAQQAYLMRAVERESTAEAKELARQRVIAELNLSPLTAQVVAIAMLNVDTERGKVLYQADELEEWKSENGKVEFASAPEDELLTEFWEVIKKYDQFVTFNGRTFDCPFLMLRSALLGVRPSRNLMPYRYDASQHVDLADQLSFYGAIEWKRRFNLDFYCRAFGIESSKSHGVTGSDVNTLYAQQRFKEIARYCLRDVMATLQLYRKWKQFLAFD
jgi:DNA polymerase elongation subunit (family B)